MMTAISTPVLSITLHSSGDKTMETEPTIELLHPEEYYEHQQWYQVNYCSVCGIDTGVGGPDCCDFCGEQDDYFYD